MTASRGNRFRVPEQLLLPWSPQATISVQRAADMLDSSRATVIRMLQRRDLTGYQLWPGKAGSPWRIQYESVLKFLDKMHKEAGVERRFEL